VPCKGHGVIAALEAKVARRKTALQVPLLASAVALAVIGVLLPWAIGVCLFCYSGGGEFALTSLTATAFDPVGSWGYAFIVGTSAVLVSTELNEPSLRRAVRTAGITAAGFAILLPIAVVLGVYPSSGWHVAPSVGLWVASAGFLTMLAGLFIRSDT